VVGAGNRAVASGSAMDSAGQTIFVADVSFPNFSSHGESNHAVFVSCTTRFRRHILPDPEPSDCEGAYQ
jgi:hypothetical protein